MKSVPFIKDTPFFLLVLAAIPTSLLVGFLLLIKIPGNFFSGLMVYTGIYGLFVIFVIVVRRLTESEFRKSENCKTMDLNLKLVQLQGLKAQIDPHFIFNILNTVASLIYLDDREKAYDYMIKFTQLLRRIFNDSDDIYRTLADELELVNIYLDLEKLRFGDKMKYEINMGDGVTQKEPVPKFVIQTFAENAVNYGILPLTSDGLLRINIEKEPVYLKLLIEDNGIKRSGVAGIGKTAVQRLNLTNELFEILNQMNEDPIKYNISDLYSNDNVYTGTRVEIWVPLHVNK
jgi:LytS/YehU family sensor histidine kinase